MSKVQNAALVQTNKIGIHMCVPKKESEGDAWQRL